MKYKAYFSFDFYREDTDETPISNDDNPVQMLMVDGGTNRMINLRATDDISLVSELKQAQEFKNIILYLSSTKNHKDMKAALDLVEIANGQKEIVMTLVIERFLNNGKLIEGIQLFEMLATLKNQPRSAVDNTMMVTINLPFAELHQGKIKNHQLKDYSKQL